MQAGEAFQQELELSQTEKEREELIEEIQREAMSKARMQADKIYRKNKRELSRLNKHAQSAVLENNFEAYKYALEKSRDILRQPYNDELIATMWQTTRRQIWEIINAGSKKV